MVELIIIDAPYSLGEKLEYAGPEVDLRGFEVAQELGLPWVEIEPIFTPDLDPVTAVNQALAQAVAAHPRQVPLIFAGDCVACLGAMKGLEARQPAVIWFDAHGDFNTPETSPSGFLGGMPLAALVGRGNEDLMTGLELAPIAEADVLFTDGRDLDPEEGVNLRASAVQVFPETGALLEASLPYKPLYIHLDLDVVNLDEMPACTYPAPGGPSAALVEQVLRRILRDGETAGLLISLFDERHSGAPTARRTTLRLIHAAVEELRRRA